MRIALASPPVAASLDAGLEQVQRYIADAAAALAVIVCFPEAYLPGLRGQDFSVPPFTAADEDRVVRTVSACVRQYGVVTILGMERVTAAGHQIAAVVFNADGTVQGVQTKNQLDPTEEPNYIPGDTRRLFEVSGCRFGVAICHEAWRYPETVRWAATRGAHIVFQPQLTGSDRAGPRLTQWGAADSPYYEKAMLMRSKENTIYFASVNYGLAYQESATSLISPDGECQAYLPYGRPGLLVEEIDLQQATGLLATRYAPERYREDA